VLFLIKSISNRCSIYDYDATFCDYRAGFGLYAAAMVAAILDAKFYGWRGSIVMHKFDFFLENFR
jgi:hypothetical protein